jgi:hypothetical protein
MIPLEFPFSKLFPILFSILVSDESHVNNFERYVSSCVFPNTILPLITASPRLVSAPLVAKVPSPFILKDSDPPVYIIISAFGFT